MQVISIYVSIDPQSKMDSVTNLWQNDKYHFRFIPTIIIVFNFMIALLSSNETHYFACPFFLYKFNKYAKKLRHSRGCCCALFSFYAFLLRYMLFYTCKLTRSNILHWWIVDHVALHTHKHTHTHSSSYSSIWFCCLSLH